MCQLLIGSCKTSLLQPIQTEGALIPIIKGYYQVVAVGLEYIRLLSIREEYNDSIRVRLSRVRNRYNDPFK
jgi:hypothetical protein